MLFAHYRIVAIIMINLCRALDDLVDAFSNGTAFCASRTSSRTDDCCFTCWKRHCHKSQPATATASLSSRERCGLSLHFGWQQQAQCRFWGVRVPNKLEMVQLLSSYAWHFVVVVVVVVVGQSLGDESPAIPPPMKKFHFDFVLLLTTLKKTSLQV